MKISFDIACAPEESCPFFRLTDIAPAIEALVQNPITRAGSAAGEKDPDKLIKQFAKAHRGKK